MPYDDPDPQDPMILVGVTFPGDPESQVEMVHDFAEEFARLGFGEEQILALFQRSFYAGAHAAYLTLGEERIVKIIRENLEVWGRVRFVDRDAPAGDADLCQVDSDLCGSGGSR